MSKKSILISLLFLLISSLQAEEWHLIISKSCTSEDEMEDEKISIKNIYLKKQRFLGQCPLSPLNLSSQHPMRKYFSKEVLNVSQKSWVRYYNEMHFKGIDPPHIVSSPQSMLKYLKNIDGALGYLPSSFITEETLEDFTILLKFQDD